MGRAAKRKQERNGSHPWIQIREDLERNGMPMPKKITEMIDFLEDHYEITDLRSRIEQNSRDGLLSVLYVNNPQEAGRIDVFRSDFSYLNQFPIAKLGMRNYKVRRIPGYKYTFCLVLVFDTHGVDGDYVYQLLACESPDEYIFPRIDDPQTITSLPELSFLR